MNNHKLIASILAVCLCAGLFTAMISPSADAADTTHEIKMFEGDSFSYTPALNLTGASISATGTGLTSNGGFLTFTGGTLSGTATTSGTYTVVLTASWSSGSLTQSASQTITFIVYKHTVITSTTYNSGAIVGQAYNYDLTYTGNGQETVTVTGLPSWLTWNNTTKKISGTPTAAAANTTSTVTVKVSNATTGDSDTLIMTIKAYNDLAFLSSAVTAVVNKTAYTYTVSVADVPDVVVTKVSGPSWLTYNSTTKVFSGTPNLTITGEYQDFTVKLRATSAILGKSVDQDFTVRVWANLDYVDVPTADMVVTAQGMLAQISFTGFGADIVLYDFGDNASQYADPAAEISHEYGSEGTYLISCTAFNEYGSNTMITMFDALGDEDGAGVPDDSEGSTWLSDHSLVVAIALLFIAALIGGALFKRVSIGVIAAILAILLIALIVGDIGTIDDLMGTLGV